MAKAREYRISDDHDPITPGYVFMKQADAAEKAEFVAIATGRGYESVVVLAEICEQSPYIENNPEARALWRALKEKYAAMLTEENR